MMDEEDVGSELFPPGVEDDPIEENAPPSQLAQSPQTGRNPTPITDGNNDSDVSFFIEPDVSPPGTNPSRKHWPSREQSSNPFSSPHGQHPLMEKRVPVVNFDDDVDFTTDDAPWTEHESEPHAQLNSHSPFKSNQWRGRGFYGSNPPREPLAPPEQFRGPRRGRGRSRGFRGGPEYPPGGYEQWNYDYDMYSYGYPGSYDNGSEYQQDEAFSDFSGAHPVSLPECPVPYESYESFESLSHSNPPPPGSNPPPPPTSAPPLPSCSNPPPPSTIPLPDIPFPLCVPPLPPSDGRIKSDAQGDQLNESRDESSCTDDLNSSFYSPSQSAAEDESSTSQPTPTKSLVPVIGKELAKKRLRAFQLSKQANLSASAPKNPARLNDSLMETSLDDDSPSTTSSTAPSDEIKKKKTKAGTREDQLRATVASIEALKREELNLIRAHSRSVHSVEYLPLAPLLDSASNPLLAGLFSLPAEKEKGKDEKPEKREDRDRRRHRRRSRSHSRDRKHKDKHRGKEAEKEKRKDSGKSKDKGKDKETDKEKDKDKAKDKSRQNKEEEKKKDSSIPQSWSECFPMGYTAYEDFETLRNRIKEIEKKNSKGYTKETSKNSREQSTKNSKDRFSIKDESKNEDSKTDSGHVKSSQGAKVSFLDLPRRHFKCIVTSKDGTGGLDGKDETEYSESMLQYTKTRPGIVFCGNLKTKKLKYDSRAEIIERAPEDILDTFNFFFEGKRRIKTKDSVDLPTMAGLAVLQESYEDNAVDEEKNNMQEWYSHHDYLLSRSEEPNDDFSILEGDKTIWEKPIQPELSDIKAKADNVADMSETSSPHVGADAEELTLASDRATVRSKWDSDFEDVDEEFPLSKTDNAVDEPEKSDKDVPENPLNDKLPDRDKIDEKSLAGSVATKTNDKKSKKKKKRRDSRTHENVDQVDSKHTESHFKKDKIKSKELKLPKTNSHEKLLSTSDAPGSLKISDWEDEDVDKIRSKQQSSENAPQKKVESKKKRHDSIDNQTDLNQATDKDVWEDLSTQKAVKNGSSPSNEQSSSVTDLVHASVKPKKEKRNKHKNDLEDGITTKENIWGSDDKLDKSNLNVMKSESVSSHPNPSEETSQANPLASEYEEFMKFVEVSDDNVVSQSKQSDSAAENKTTIAAGNADWEASSPTFPADTKKDKTDCSREKQWDEDEKEIKQTGANSSHHGSRDSSVSELNAQELLLTKAGLSTSDLEQLMVDKGKRSQDIISLVDKELNRLKDKIRNKSSKKKKTKKSKKASGKSSSSDYESSSESEEDAKARKKKKRKSSENKKKKQKRSRSSSSSSDSDSEDGSESEDKKKKKRKSKKGKDRSDLKVDKHSKKEKELSKDPESKTKKGKRSKTDDGEPLTTKKDKTKKKDKELKRKKKKGKAKASSSSSSDSETDTSSSDSDRKSKKSKKKRDRKKKRRKQDTSSSSSSSSSDDSTSSDSDSDDSSSSDEPKKKSKQRKKKSEAASKGTPKEKTKGKKNKSDSKSQQQPVGEDVLKSWEEEIAPSNAKGSPTETQPQDSSVQSDGNLKRKYDMNADADTFDIEAAHPPKKSREEKKSHGDDQDDQNKSKEKSKERGKGRDSYTGSKVDREAEKSTGDKREQTPVESSTFDKTKETIRAKSKDSHYKDSQSKDSHSKDTQTKNSHSKDSQSVDPQTKDSYSKSGDSESKDSQPKDSQPKKFEAKRGASPWYSQDDEMQDFPTNNLKLQGEQPRRRKDREPRDGRRSSTSEANRRPDRKSDRVPERESHRNWERNADRPNLDLEPDEMEVAVPTLPPMPALPVSPTAPTAPCVPNPSVPDSWAAEDKYSSDSMSIASSGSPAREDTVVVDIPVPVPVPAPLSSLYSVPRPSLAEADDGWGEVPEPLPPGVEDSDVVTPTKSRAPITVKLGKSLAMTPRARTVLPLAAFEEDAEVAPRPRPFAFDLAPTPTPARAPSPPPAPAPSLESPPEPAKAEAPSVSRWRSIGSEVVEAEERLEPADKKTPTTPKSATGVVVMVGSAKRASEEQRSKRKSRWGEKPPAETEDAAALDDPPRDVRDREHRVADEPGQDPDARPASEGAAPSRGWSEVPFDEGPGWQDAFQDAFQDPSWQDPTLEPPISIPAPDLAVIRAMDEAMGLGLGSAMGLGETMSMGLDKTDYDNMDLAEPEAEKKRDRDRERDRDRDRSKRDQDRGRRDRDRRDDGRKRRTRSRSAERRSERSREHDRNRDRERDRDRDRGRGGRRDRTPERDRERDRDRDRDRDRRRKREDERRGGRESPDKRRRRDHRRRSSSISGRSGSEELRRKIPPPDMRDPDIADELRLDKEGGYSTLPFSPMGLERGGQHDLVHGGQHDLVHGGQHDLVHGGQRDLVHGGQHDLVHGGQHDLVHGGQHDLHHDVRHGLLHDQLHDVPHPGHHGLPYGGHHEAAGVSLLGAEPSVATSTSMACTASSSNSPVMGYRRSLADSTTIDADLQGKRDRQTAGHVSQRSGRSKDYEESKSMQRTSQFEDEEEEAEEEVSSPSPKRISLDDRIELELGRQMGLGRHPPPATPVPQAAVPPQYMYPPYPGYTYPGYPAAVPPGPAVSSAASRVLQVGNMLQVVPVDTPPAVPLAVAPVLHPVHPHIPLQPNHVPVGSSRKAVPSDPLSLSSPSSSHIKQVGNMIQVVPVSCSAQQQAVSAPGPVPGHGHRLSPGLAANEASPTKRAVASSPQSAPLPVPAPIAVPATPAAPAAPAAPAPVPVPAPALTRTPAATPVAASTAPSTAPQSSLAAAAAAVAAAIAANSPDESAKDDSVAPHPQPGKSITELPFLPPDLVTAMEEERIRKRKERELRRQQREERRKQKELRRQQKIKKAAELYKKKKKSKALLQEGQLLRSEFEMEEMRLIEEAMLNSDLADGTEYNDAEAGTAGDSAVRKRLKPVPLPPAGKGILISPAFSREDASGGPPAPKEVKFADGVKPGDGTSPSAGEEISSPLPLERTQKKKVVKKKRMKKKIKVQVVRTLPLEDDDDDDDDSSPPPPPPGSPPPSAYPPGTYPYATGTTGFSYPPPGFPVLPTVPVSTPMFQQFAQPHQLPPPPPVKK